MVVTLHERTNTNVHLILICFLSLIAFSAQSQDTLIDKESTWKYQDNNANLGTAWRDSGFVGASFKTGQGPFGVGGITGATMNTTIINRLTTYYIYQVSVSDHLNGTLDFNILCDDGFVLYINGKEAMRDNMGTGTISHTSTASSAINGSNEGDYDNYNALDTFLIDGINVFAVELHNEKASSSDIGFDLEVIATEGIDSSKYLFFKESEWKYTDDGSNLGTSWIDSNYNDAGWSSGDAIFGYGTLDGSTVTTTLSFGSNSSDKYPTTYFRKQVTLSGLDYKKLTINLLADDAAAVYINGKLAIADGMPATWDYLTYATFTASGTDEGDYDSYTIPDTFLIDGVNTFAVEMHQVNATSSDLGFDMEILGIQGFLVEGQIYMDMDGNGQLSAYDIFGSGAVEIKFYDDADSNSIFTQSEILDSVLTDPDGSYSVLIEDKINHLGVALQTEDMDVRCELTSDTSLSFSISDTTTVITANFGQLGPRSMCLMIADDQSANDRYYIANRISGKNKYISTLDVNEIEALAIRIGMDSAWACDAGQFGTIDISTGQFTPIGSGIGTGTGLIGGALGSLALDDVDGMAYDGVNHILYGTHKTSGWGNNDVLFAINRSSGSFIPDFFGTGIDFVKISGTNVKSDIDDIAFNPNTNQLLAVNMQGSGDSTRYISIDPSNGAATVISITGVGDFESLGYYNTGELYGTTGVENKSGYPANTFYKIDRSTGIGTKLDTLYSGAIDVEACDCLTGPTENLISGVVFFDEDSSGVYDNNDSTYGGIWVYLFKDVNENGIIDSDDYKLDSTTTDLNTGFYVFITDSLGKFITTPLVRFTQLLTMNTTTNDSLTEFAEFVLHGDFDGQNDFGFHLTGGIPYLPVEWLNVSVKWTKNKNGAVTWSTASETNSSHYEVERKIKNGDFEYLGRIEATSNTNSTTDYSFIDFDANKQYRKHIIYRVKQIDFDNAFDYSKAVVLTKEITMIVSVYPNPIDDFVNVTIDNHGEYNITITDIAGNLIIEKTGSNYDTFSPITIGELNQLRRGIYLMQVTCNGEDKVVKLIK